MSQKLDTPLSITSFGGKPMPSDLAGFGATKHLDPLDKMLVVFPNHTGPQKRVIDIIVVVENLERK